MVEYGKKSFSEVEVDEALELAHSTMEVKAIQSLKLSTEKSEILGQGWSRVTKIVDCIRCGKRTTGLDYLHSFTSLHVHKNLKSGNIFLYSNFRARIANFGLARSLEREGEGDQYVMSTLKKVAQVYEEGDDVNLLDVSSAVLGQVAGMIDTCLKKGPEIRPGM
ncbi:hypothetical protein Fmac_014878 [Flemingia macrophylla]|uniref:Protein kinase domain-containing protein n=1 Tax=Flemingia macrophylla TaxID=520843 RepID=A0ABD1MF03_9FABA